MPSINILPKQVAELIAAGEVIERPASVIKELVENAIDAGSTAITVEIKNGGVTFMRVSDNGCGILREDVKKAFLRHATSKIAQQEDLDAIGTLGFRGEALASICAVSRMEVMTRSADEQTGTLYRLEGGEETLFQEAGCPQGTTFVVRDLFYNVPARMKFLKKDVAESNSIATLMDRIALSHPEIGFTFIRDGKQMLKTSGKGDLKTAIYQVFGRQLSESLLPVQYQYQGVALSGFVSKPVSANRASRNMQIFFVNGRYVRSKTAMAAIEQAYKGFIMVGKYPACVLMLDMDCGSLDVNVHPAKLEIRFTNERPVYECVYHGVRMALSEYDTRKAEAALPPELTPRNPKLLGQTAQRGTQLGFSYQPETPRPPAEEPEIFTPAPAEYTPLSLHDPAAEARMTADEQPVRIRPINLAEYQRRRTEPYTPSVEEETPAPAASLSTEPEPAAQPASSELSELTAAEKPDVTLTELEEDIGKELLPPQPTVAEPTVVDENLREKKLTYIGELFRTYILVEYDSDRLMVIDKHAAHERLIYERLKREHEFSGPQLLLEPVVITLDKTDRQAVLENKELLLGAGFEVEEFGGGAVLLRSVPLMLEKLEVTEAFLEIASYLSRHKRLVLTDKMEWIYANTACRAAIKAGDKNEPEELMALVRELEKNPDVKHCPHGRPIWFFIGKNELEKNFRRI